MEFIFYSSTSLLCQLRVLYKIHNLYYKRLNFYNLVIFVLLITSERIFAVDALNNIIEIFTRTKNKYLRLTSSSTFQKNVD